MDFKSALEWSNKLKKETFFTNPFFIKLNCFEKDNLLFENGFVDEQHPLLVYSDVYEDISNNVVGTGFDEDIDKIVNKYQLNRKENLGFEFYYSTNDWINLEGQEFRNIRKAINKFQKENKFKILMTYPKDKIINFLKEWANDKRKKETTEFTKELFEDELNESISNLDLIDSVDHKNIYIEVNDKLVGFCIFFNYFDNFWIALMQKTKHNYRGLPQLLYHLKAKEMGENQIFTTGAEAQDENLKQFKESLRPCKINKIYTLYIGSKLTP